MARDAVARDRRHVAVRHALPPRGCATRSRHACAVHAHVHLRVHLRMVLAPRRSSAVPSEYPRATVPPCAGRSWIKLMSRWLVQMAFSFIVVDVFVVYLRYNLYCAFKSRFVKRTT